MVWRSVGVCGGGGGGEGGRERGGGREGGGGGEGRGGGGWGGGGGGGLKLGQITAMCHGLQYHTRTRVLNQPANYEGMSLCVSDPPNGSLL